MTHLLRRFVTAALGTVLITLGAAAAATAAADPVETTTQISCVSPQTYTGTELTPCTATVTAADSSMV